MSSPREPERIGWSDLDHSFDQRRKVTPRGEVTWREHLCGPIRQALLEVVDSPEFLTLRGPEPKGRVAPYPRSVPVDDRVARDWKRALAPANFFLS